LKSCQTQLKPNANVKSGEYNIAKKLLQVTNTSRTFLLKIIVIEVCAF